MRRKIAEAFLEHGQAEERLQRRRKVAAIPEVLDAGVARSIGRYELLTVTVDHVKIKLHVLLELQLRHTLLCFA